MAGLGLIVQEMVFPVWAPHLRSGVFCQLVDKQPPGRRRCTGDYLTQSQGRECVARTRRCGFII